MPVMHFFEYYTWIHFTLLRLSNVESTFKMHTKKAANFYNFSVRINEPSISDSKK